MAQRYFIAEVDENGGEWKAGNQSGYKTDKEAYAAAERAANKSGRSHSVSLYETLPGGDRDLIELLGYEHPAEATP